MECKISSKKPLIGSIIIGAVTVIPRFAPGIPQGVDSTSHLSKILFIINSYSSLHYIPSWYPDWYGGAPFLLLYSPLSYILTFAVALSGIDGVSAYKIVDATFYVATPIAVYILGREFGLNSEEAAWGSLLFTLTPTVIGNHLFYDRFPNIVALPITCLFIVSLSRMFKGKSMVQSTIMSILLFSILILTHHLSAFIALILVLIAYLSLPEPTKRLKATLLVVAVIVGALSVSSPWLLKFLEASGQILRNPFYNRTVDFPFMRLSYALIDYLTVEQGIFHFCLGSLALYQSYSNSRYTRTIYPLGISILFLGMAVFEYVGDSWFRVFGQGLVVTAFLSLMGLVLYIERRFRDTNNSRLLLSLWFLTFLWLGLGNYAMPLVNLPPVNVVWRSLDVHRFWLYLAVPAALLAGKVAVKAMHNRTRAVYPVGFLTILAIMIIGASAKGVYVLSQNVNPHLPYTTWNSEIPKQVIDYFKSESDHGRILPIRCPMWVYVLPSYVGKPLIDGWYPQEKLIPDLLSINDYRINDLETSENRTRIWRWLIDRNQELAIRWVLIGNANSTLINILANSTFKEDAYITYGKGNLTILKNSIPNLPIKLSCTAGSPDIQYYRPAPDIIRIDIKNGLQDVSLTVREAYDHGWKVKIDDTTRAVYQSPEGMILVHVESTPSRIILFHRHPNNLYTYYISSISILILTIFLAWSMIHKMRTG
ncbi:MAG: 6-pyruvoyl-tetrahydropterin synthase-related protein [Candidatus Bathyarchaeia archaeon]